MYAQCTSPLHIWACCSVFSPHTLTKATRDHWQLASFIFDFFVFFLIFGTSALTVPSTTESSAQPNFTGNKMKKTVRINMNSALSQTDHYTIFLKLGQMHYSAFGYFSFSSKWTLVSMLNFVPFVKWQSVRNSCIFLCIKSKKKKNKRRKCIENEFNKILYTVYAVRVKKKRMNLWDWLTVQRCENLSVPSRQVHEW